jgi:hypothetical protein
MRDGQASQRPALAEIRERHRREIARMPESLLPLDGASPYPVHLSEKLQRLQQQATEDVRRRELGSPIPSPSPIRETDRVHE